MSDENQVPGTNPWLKIPSWALPFMYVMGGGTRGFGGLSLTIDRDEEEVVAAPEELPPEPSIDDGVEAGTETIDTVNPVECPEQEATDPVACDSSIADSLRDQLLDTRTRLSKCKARRRADDD